MSRRLIFTTFACLAVLAAGLDGSAGADSLDGKPAIKPLPAYCQMGECTIQTVEKFDPVLFDSRGVLFEVLSQNWSGGGADQHRNLIRDADSTSYVFCSKKFPAVISEEARNKYTIQFLAPNDSSSYFHSVQTVYQLFFAVCHGREFAGAQLDGASFFAERLGYAVKPRDNQVIVDQPEKILDHLDR